MTHADLTFLDTPPPKPQLPVPGRGPPPSKPDDPAVQVAARTQLQAPTTSDPLLETFPAGPNLRSPNQKSHKEIPQEIMAVYHQLGGTEWLLLMAKAYPKEFLSMIKPLIPKDISINADFKGINLAIIDTFSTPDALLTEDEQAGVVDATFNIVGDHAKQDTESKPG